MPKPNDYPITWAPQHPKSFNGGWYYTHRLVLEQHLGRVLESWETVHHISENKDDCSLENIFVCTRSDHDLAVWHDGLDPTS